MAQSAAGNRFNFGLFLDSDGLPIGRTHTRPAAGTSVNGGPIRFRMPKSVTPTSSPAPTPTLSTGEDGLDQHRYPFAADNTQVTQLIVSAEDLGVVALVDNMPIIGLAGGEVLNLGENGDPFDMCLIIQSWSRDFASGVMKWQPLIYPRATLTYAGRDGFNERGVAQFRYDFMPQPVQYQAWGATLFNASGVQVSKDRITGAKFDHPLVFQAFTGDNSETTFGLDYKPVSAAKASAFVSDPTLGIRGTVGVSVDSVAITAPYTATLGSAPVSGARGVIAYQFEAA